MILFVITMSLLLLPKVWGVIATSWHSKSSAGGFRVLASVLIEAIASMLIAPILMLLHTRFVASALLGTKVKWVAQCRKDSGVSLRSAFAVHYPHTLCGLAIGGIAWFWAPGLLLWLLPVLAGLVLAVPLATVAWQRFYRNVIGPQRSADGPGRGCPAAGLEVSARRTRRRDAGDKNHV